MSTLTPPPVGCLRHVRLGIPDLLASKKKPGFIVTDTGGLAEDWFPLDCGRDDTPKNSGAIL